VGKPSEIVALSIPVATGLCKLDRRLVRALLERSLKPRQPFGITAERRVHACEIPRRERVARIGARRAKKERKGGLTVACLGERASEIVKDRRDPLTVSRRFRKRPHRALEILLLKRPPSARIVVVGEDEIRSEIAGRSLEAPRPELGPLPDRANHLACWSFG